MNPALPVLVLLTVGGLAVAGGMGRGPAGRAWLLLGLAGMALLAPALSMPDGIPSPAANLAEFAPWQDVADRSEGNPNLRDIPHQIQPWLLFLRGEWRSGRPGFWNPHQFAGTPFWANGQSAPLFPLHVLFVLVPTWLGWVLLPWLRFVLGGFGAWLLARELGLREEGAVVAALIFPLSGMLVSMLLFPMGNALALVPWIFWAAERWATGKSHGALLAGLAGLQLLGGHPETCVHTALLTAVYLGIRLYAFPKGPSPSRRGVVGVRVRTLLLLPVAWILGAGLAAVALWPLALFVLESTKFLEHADVTRPPVAVAFREVLRLVLPEAYGHPAEGTWFGPFNYAATASYAGALAIPLAAAGLARVRRSPIWTAVAATGLVSFLLAYHLPGLWDLIIQLPLLERVAHHRLIFGVELALALLAGAGLDRWLRGRGRGIAVGSGVVLVLLGAAWLLFADSWQTEGLVRSQAGWTVGVAGLALAAAGAAAVPRGRRSALALLVPAALAVDLLHAHGGILRALPETALYPVTPAVELVLDRPGRVVGMGRTLAPNAAMVYGLYDLRGDDPVKPARFERLYRRLAPADAVYFRPLNRWDDELLDRLSVRWVMGEPGREPAKADWSLVYDGADARVWERPGALPMVRGSNADVEVERREAGAWELTVSAERATRLEIAEMWAPGWRARVDGEPVPVTTWEPVAGAEMSAVDVPPGRHRVRLVYRAPGFVPGAVVSGLSLLLLVGWARLPCHNPHRIEP